MEEWNIGTERSELTDQREVIMGNVHKSNYPSFHRSIVLIV